MDKEGLLICAKYALPPNFFGYCGPDKSLSLIDHLKEGVIDREVNLILSQFETLYPYLVLIAKENKINDPFNKKVVEAYWIGNQLLNKVSSFNYLALLNERLLIEDKVGIKEFKKIKNKIFSIRFFPHHSFHVFNIFKRTGHDHSFHTLQTMDECRIGWGKIKKLSILDSFLTIFVETQPLVFEKRKLKLGKPIIKKIKVDYNKKTFLSKLNIGDWISFHWGFICDILTKIQIKNLFYYTQKSIDYFNNDYF